MTITQLKEKIESTCPNFCLKRPLELGEEFDDWTEISLIELWYKQQLAFLIHVSGENLEELQIESMSDVPINMGEWTKAVSILKQFEKEMNV